MEMDNSPSLDSNTGSEITESPAVDTTPSDVSASPEVTQSAPVEGAPATPAYEPNFKYKAAGKEYELDEEYRGYVKGPDDEKRIKRLMEQAKAFEHVHGEKEKFRTEREHYESELKTFHSGLESIKELRSKGDVRGALMSLGLSSQEILMAAKQELDFDALPQQAKDNYYQSQESQRQAQYLAQQNQNYANQMAALATTVRSTELSSALEQPDIKDFQTWYDNQHGKPGLFRQRVIQTGSLQSQMTGKDLSVAEVIQMVTEEFKPFRPQPSMNQPQMPNAPQVPQAPKQVPVIPSAKGASQSAPQLAIRSIKDLDRAYEEHMARKGRSL